MHRTRVILTVDTEADIAGAMRDRTRYPPLLDEPVWGEIEGRSEGLGFITRTLANHGLQATFFVEALHTRYFGQERMKRYTDHLLELGQDIQLHIHPVWQNFSLPPSAPQQHYDDASILDEAELVQLIEEGCEQLRSWTGQKPVAMRTGNFAASRVVYRAMASAGLYLASNVCVASFDYSDESLRLPGGIHKIEGVREIPASCFTDRGPVGRGSFRAAQITACSSRELISLLRQCTEQSIGTLVLVTHPFEFIKRKDFRYSRMRPNGPIQGRLERLCEFLDRHKTQFEACTFGALAGEALPDREIMPGLETSVAASLTRSAQNFLNDRF